ncbi:MAG: ATP-grasp domain-containing protein [Bacteroidetes bacterium]|nr:ATP-grasp domain-containing protein [Bacteroidota bacterium]
MNLSDPQDFDSREIRILIIDDNSPFVLPLLRSFSAYKNIHLDILLSSGERTEHFRYSRYLGKIEKINELNDGNIEAVIRKAVTMFNSDLLIPTREWISVLLFNHTAELEKFVKLHPLPKASTLEITNNKYKLNHWLKSNGFPFARTSETIMGWTGDFPVLLKPVSGIGGKGIRFLDDSVKLKMILGNSTQYKDNFFLQEYIEGYDIDVSFFAVDGDVIYHTIQRGIISKQLEYSKGIEFVKNENLFNQVSEMIRKLNYTGIAHLDFRYSARKKQYILIDYNSRYWSTMNGSSAMGINFPYLVVEWIFSRNGRVMNYRTGYYFFSTAFLKTRIRSLFSNSAYPAKLRDSQLSMIYRDPMPELMFLASKIMKSMKK